MITSHLVTCPAPQIDVSATLTVGNYSRLSNIELTVRGRNVTSKTDPFADCNLDEAVALAIGFADLVRKAKRQSPKLLAATCDVP